MPLAHRTSAAPHIQRIPLTTCVDLYRLWSPTDGKPIDLEAYIQNEVISARGNAQRRVSNMVIQKWWAKADSVDNAGTISGPVEDRPKSARHARSELASRQTPAQIGMQWVGFGATTSKGLDGGLSTPPSFLAGMFNMVDHKPAVRRPMSACRPQSARVGRRETPEMGLLAARPESARRPHSAKASALDRGGSIAVRPWSTQTGSALRPQSARALSRATIRTPSVEKGVAPRDAAGPRPDSGNFYSTCQSLDTPARRELQVVGRTRLLKPKKKHPQNPTGDQWIPVPGLGPTPAHFGRSRFTKEGGIFVEGISAADWAKRKVLREKSVESASEKKPIIQEDSIDWTKFQDDAQSLAEESIQDDIERQVVEEEAELIAEEVYATERHHRSAFDQERRAAEELARVEEEMKRMAAARLETAKALTELEYTLETQDASDSDDNSSSSEDDIPQDNDGIFLNQRLMIGIAGLVTKKTIKKGAWHKVFGFLGMDFAEKLAGKWRDWRRQKKLFRFQVQEEVDEKAELKKMSKALKKQLTTDGMTEAEFFELLKQRKMLLGSGGSLHEETAHKAFTKHRNPVNHRLDFEGFLDAVKDLKQLLGVDPALLEKMYADLGYANQRASDASKCFGGLSDAENQMRAAFLARNAKLRQGEVLVKRASLLRFGGMKPEEEIAALQKAIDDLNTAVDCFVIAEASEPIVTTVKEIIRLSVRQGRLLADSKQFLTANVLIRRIILLCNQHKFATSPDKNEIYPEVQEALAFVRQLFAFSQELLDDSCACLAQAEKSLLLEDFEAVLLALIVSQALEQDSLLVRGISISKAAREVRVLVPPKSITQEPADVGPFVRDVESARTKREELEWKWEWVGVKRSQNWHRTANDAIEKMLQSIQMYLAQGMAREANKSMQALKKFTEKLGLENPGVSLMEEVERSNRDAKAVEELENMTETARRCHDHAWMLEDLLVRALDTCLDADDFRAVGDKANDIVRPEIAKIGPKMRFWESKWLDTGRDVLVRISTLGLEVLTSEFPQAGQESKKSKGELVSERIEVAKNLLDAGRKFQAALLNRWVPPSAAEKVDVEQELTPLEREMNRQLEGKWETLFAEQMQWCHQQLQLNDLKSTRKGLERARAIYCEGLQAQKRSRRQHEKEDAAVAHHSPYLQIKVEDVETAKVELPAEWHMLQTKIESLGADGLARAKKAWLKYTTKLQVINGCVDLMNISKLINDVKLNPKLLRDSDDESGGEERKREEEKTKARAHVGEKNRMKIFKPPTFVKLDHKELLDRLRKSSTMARSKVLGAIANFSQHELEVIDICQVRTLSEGECLVKQGETLSSFFIVMRGSVKLVLPFRSRPESIEQSGAATEKDAVRGGSGTKAQENDEMKDAHKFAFGTHQPEFSAPQSAPTGHKRTLKDSAKQIRNSIKVLNAFGVLVDHDARTQVAQMGAWRVLGEFHVVLQLPYYADIVAAQNDTEVMQITVPSATLAMLQRIVPTEDPLAAFRPGESKRSAAGVHQDDGSPQNSWAITALNSTDSPTVEEDAQAEMETEKDTEGFWRLGSAEQRILDARQCVQEAFLKVRHDTGEIERALNLALEKNAGGDCKLLAALSASSLQALLEGSTSEEVHAETLVIAQGSTLDHMLLVISGKFIIESPETSQTRHASLDGSESEQIPKVDDFLKTTTRGLSGTHVDSQSPEGDADESATLNMYEGSQQPAFLASEEKMEAGRVSPGQEPQTAALCSAHILVPGAEAPSPLPGRKQREGADGATVAMNVVELVAGDVVAEQEFLQISPFPASLRCIESGKLLRISLWSLGPLVRAQPALPHALHAVERLSKLLPPKQDRIRR